MDCSDEEYPLTIMIEDAASNEERYARVWAILEKAHLSQRALSTVNIYFCLISAMVHFRDIAYIKRRSQQILTNNRISQKKISIV